MSLLDCPFDPETGLWVIRSAWTLTMCDPCDRCQRPTSRARIELGDADTGISETKYVCEECAKYYIKLPKKETT